VRSFDVTPANVAAHAQLGRAFFPHMSFADAVVWTRFLRGLPARFTRFDYDFALGGSAASGAPRSTEFHPMWRTLLKKRVDVVAWEDTLPWVIEVKPIANMAALGQVLAYDWLARIEDVFSVKARKVVVCGGIDADLPGCYADFGVSVYLCDADAVAGSLAVLL